MKKFLTVLTVLTVAAVVALPVHAKDKAEKPKKAKTQQFTGIVTAVDTEKNTVAVEKKKETKTFTCNDATKVVLASKEAGTTADVKQGVKVKIDYTTQDDVAVCKTISIVPPKEKKAKKAKTE